MSKTLLLKADDKVYAVYNEKTMALYHIGTDPIENGMNILGAHVDSPRLDVKQNPVYENTGYAYFDTHYYGGIKKYQWVTIPLAIHGVVVKKDGTKVNVCVGENAEDPVFAITDILPHLGKPQMEKPAPKIIEGENLDLLIGSEPCEKKEDSEEKELIRNNILNILKDKYGIEEEDFLSAELEVVPSGKARELGFDRSMIIGYGQDGQRKGCRSQGYSGGIWLWIRRSHVFWGWQKRYCHVQGMRHFHLYGQWV